MKTKTLLIAAVMFLCLSAAAFAQSIYTTSSTPVTTVIKSGNAELTGDITFTGTGTSIMGTITIQYGGTNVNITSPFPPTATNAITVKKDGATVAGLGVNLVASVYSPGLLVIDIPAGLAPVLPATTYAITISRVRVQIDGTGLTSLIGTISATGNLIAAGSTTLTVINSTTGDGIATGGVSSYNADVPVPTATLATPSNPSLNSVNGSFTAGAPLTQKETITVKEGFLAAFSKDVGVRVRVTATPPKGVSFSFPATIYSYNTSDTTTPVVSTWTRGSSTSRTPSTSAVNITSSSTSTSSRTLYYYVATDNGPTTIETLEIPVTITSDPTVETFPLPSKVFTVNVSLAPVQPPYETDTGDADYGTPVGLLAPRFTALDVGPTNLLTIATNTTSLLMPYVSLGGGFDTGIAISNTTEDPGSTALGFTAAVSQSGPITFYFFSQDNTKAMFSYTTASTSPGSGLVSGTGNVQAGGTYVVLLSQLLTAAGQGNTFAGYIIAVTNFTNAHGIFVLSNFTTFGQSALMQVLGPDRTLIPEKLFN